MTLSEPEPVTGPWVYTEAVYLFFLAGLPNENYSSGVEDSVPVDLDSLGMVVLGILKERKHEHGSRCSN